MCRARHCRWISVLADTRTHQCARRVAAELLLRGPASNGGGGDDQLRGGSRANKQRAGRKGRPAASGSAESVARGRHKTVQQARG